MMYGSILSVLETVNRITEGDNMTVPEGRRRNQLLDHFFSTWHAIFVHIIATFPRSTQIA